MPKPSQETVSVTFGGCISRGVAVALALVWGYALIAARDRPPPNQVSSRFECGTDPADFLRAGELLEPTSLRFIVHSHCTNVRYLTDERIELRYGGIPIAVETTRLDIGGTTYYKIVSVDGITAP
jgi:hypothetical protein